MESIPEEAAPLVSGTDDYKDMDRRLVPEFERQKAAKLIEEGNYNDAIKALSKAVMAFEFLVKDNQLSKEHIIDMLRSTVIPCYSNITLCYLKKEEFEHVVTFASRVIENDRENTKAHYRRGVAYKKLKKYDESIRDLERAKLLDSSLTDAINNILREISALQKSQKVKQKKIAEKLLEGYGEAINEDLKSEQKQGAEPSTWSRVFAALGVAWRTAKNLFCPRRDEKEE